MPIAQVKAWEDTIALLKLGILPELGGRLLFLFNKSTGEEAIYHNHALKWARIGIRGA